MPKTKTFLTPAEYAVLGLVRRKPAYGYELQRLLAGKRGLGRVCPVEPAMVYAILKSLSGLELIDGVWDNSAYPPKAIYTATPQGEAEFERWLRRPVGRMREVRLDFLIKLHFALDEDSFLARELVSAQIEACDEYAADIERERTQEAPPVGFDAIVLESKASAARSTRDWLEKCLAGLSSPRGS
ncbi:MAG TPA: helix-turn-helix transcriptional regulator [Dehalococcoidia bacterium]|nr:helix-turn-helix transcriptional regulator [Dehalococcoidia bacterium]